MTSPPKRRWFAFRLRTLLIVVVVLGAVLTPVAIKMKKARDQKKVVEWVLENGGAVRYDWQSDNEELPPGPKWLRERIGDDCFQTVRYVSLPEAAHVGNYQYSSFEHPEPFRGNDLSALKSLREVRELHIWSYQLLDPSTLRSLTRLEVLGVHFPIEDLSWLQTTENLKVLWLSSDKAIDLSPLRGLVNLQELNLLGIDTAFDLRPLRELTSLRTLVATETGISDVRPLERLSNLKYVNIAATRVTAKQVERLQKALPNCEIIWWPVTR